MINKIFGFNVFKVLILIIILAVLSAFQKIEEVKTVMFIVSVYLCAIFVYSSIKSIRETWFI